MQFMRSWHEQTILRHREAPATVRDARSEYEMPITYLFSCRAVRSPRATRRDVIHGSHSKNKCADRSASTPDYGGALISAVSRAKLCPTAN